MILLTHNPSAVRPRGLGKIIAGREVLTDWMITKIAGR
jgi:hypothetical protein